MYQARRNDSIGDCQRRLPADGTKLTDFQPIGPDTLSVIPDQPLAEEQPDDVAIQDRISWYLRVAIDDLCFL
jgi:hypothetical protein